MALFTNPFGSGDQSDRIADITRDRADGSISQVQYDDLINDEAVSSRYLMLKRLGACGLLLTVAFFAFA